MIKLELITKWRELRHYWSVRFNLIGTAIITICTLAPSYIVQLWAELPDDVRSYIPSKYIPMIGVAMFVLSIIARNIKQPSLQKVNDNAA